MLVCELDLPEIVLKTLNKCGVERLYPPQEAAIRAGVLDGRSAVLAAPTAAGKTLVAELCMVKKILDGGRALYLVPLRAIANEKFQEFSKWSDIGVKVGVSTGDYDSVGYELEEFDILICTNEKADALMRHNSSLFSKVSVVVADEVHILNDPSRGATLEVVLTKLKKIVPPPQILALSATIKNAKEISEWIGGVLVYSTWRPVPLREGVFFDGLVEFNDGSSIVVDEVAGDAAITLAADTVKNGGQALIFDATRRGAMAVANASASIIARFLTKKEKLSLGEIVAELTASGERNKISEKLALAIKRGVAFHHAGLSPLQRRIVEHGFKENLIKVVCATPTLAAGVNLPARRVIIRNYRRSEGGIRTPIPIFEYKQMAGRAGRPKYDDVGEAVLIAKSEKEKSLLLKRYVRGEPEKVESKLSSENALRCHILSLVASTYRITEEELLNFFSGSFYAYQQGSCAKIIPTIKSTLEFLLDHGFIKSLNGFLAASQLGKRVADVYIDPLSAVKIIDGLKSAPLSEIGYLHLICTTPDMPRLYLTRKDYRLLHEFVEKNQNSFMTKIPDYESDPVEYEWFLSEVKTAFLLKEWISEVEEDRIVDLLDVGAGDVYRLVEIAEWLTYASCEIAKVLGMGEKVNFLRRMQERIRYGIKDELLGLVGLQGIGRVRARILFDAGIHSINDLKHVPLEKLVSLPTIGSETARKIKEQVSSGEKLELKTGKLRSSKLTDF